MERDMTTGKPAKILLNFTIPIFIGNVFQQFYSMADTVIVGKFVGNTALAAVGACGTLTFLILGFLMGMTAGFTVVTAQHYGAGNDKAMRRSVASAAILSLVVSVLLTAVSMALMRDVLNWMNTPMDMYDQAYAYIMVICGGIVAQVLYNLLAGILRAIGDSKRPLYFLILAALLNIVLDLVFIIVFHMGAAGAAYATVISQGVSGLLCLFYIIKYVPELHLHREDWKADWNLMKWQMKIGFPMAFQFSITAIGIIVVQTALNVFGSVAVAGYSAAVKIEQIVTQAYIALGYGNVNLLRPEHGGGKDIQNPAGISERHMDGRGLCGFNRTFGIFLRKIHDGVVCLGKCKGDYGICGYQPALCRPFFCVFSGCQYLPEWDSGNGFWIAAYDGGDCRAGGKEHGGCRSIPVRKFSWNLSGKPGGMDTGGRIAAGDVFPDYASV